MYCCAKQAVSSISPSEEGNVDVTRSPARKGPQPACYFVYDIANNGTASMQYSREPPANYIFSAYGGKPFPEWRFKSDGKIKIKTGCGTNKDFFESMIMYAKEAKKNQDTIYFSDGLNNSPFKPAFVLHYCTNRVKKFTSGAIDIVSADAVVACHSSADDYNLPSMGKDLFLLRAQQKFAGSSC